MTEINNAHYTLLFFYSYENVFLEKFLCNLANSLAHCSMKHRNIIRFPFWLIIILLFSFQMIFFETIGNVRGRNNLNRPYHSWWHAKSYGRKGSVPPLIHQHNKNVQQIMKYPSRLTSVLSVLVSCNNLSIFFRITRPRIKPDFVSFIEN